MAEPTCFLCDEGFKESMITTVREEGLKTLVESSKERKDIHTYS